MVIRFLILALKVVFLVLDMFFKYSVFFLQWIVVSICLSCHAIDQELLEDIDLRTVINVHMPSTDIAKILHAIWVGPCPIREEFRNNLLGTAERFPDFIVHFWTSWDETDNSWLSNQSNLLIHKQDELEQQLYRFKINKNTTLNDIVNQEIAYQSYPSAKDLIQFAVLFEYGGISFDLDHELNNQAEELVGASEYGYYCAACSPAFFVAARRGIFICTALNYFWHYLDVTAQDKFQTQSGFDFVDFRNHFPRTAAILTTGVVTFYANRALQLKTTDANFHRYAVVNICRKCYKSVFIFDIGTSLEFLQNDRNYSDYVSHLKTPTSFPDEDMSCPEYLYKGTEILRLITFQAFVNLVGEDKFCDCNGEAEKKKKITLTKVL